MNKQTLIASALAVLGLTACEKGLDAEGEFTSSTASQATNSVLQVTTRGGGNNNNDNSDNIPAVGDTYQGCYVLAVSVIDANSAELTLLSPNERSVSSDSDANNALATLGVDGISDWSIPTKDQIDAFYAAKDDITPAPDRQRYLWQDGTTMKQRYMSDGSDSNANFNYAIFLRPVATVSITKD